MFKYFGVGILGIIAILFFRYIAKHQSIGREIYKPVLGLLATILVFILRPVSDLYYYVVSLFSIIMSIISFYNIIENYNILTTRKLPQLGKRGGDENA